jgi:hypothetical protein
LEALMRELEEKSVHYLSQYVKGRCERVHSCFQEFAQSYSGLHKLLFPKTGGKKNEYGRYVSIGSVIASLALLVCYF